MIRRFGYSVILQQIRCAYRRNIFHVKKPTFHGVRLQPTVRIDNASFGRKLPNAFAKTFTTVLYLHVPTAVPCRVHRRPILRLYFQNNM